MQNFNLTNVLDIGNIPEFTSYKAFWKEFRVTGLKITFTPMSFANEMGGRTIKCIEMASWP